MNNFKLSNLIAFSVLIIQAVFASSSAIAFTKNDLTASSENITVPTLHGSGTSLQSGYATAIDRLRGIYPSEFLSTQREYRHQFGIRVFGNGINAIDPSISVAPNRALRFVRATINTTPEGAEQHTSQSVTLIFQSSNLYLLGVIDNIGDVYITSDAQLPQGFRNYITRTTNRQIHSLGFAGDYRSLERTANLQRSHLRFDRNFFRTDMLALSTAGSSGQQANARAILTMAIAFSEAARFQNPVIRDHVRTAIGLVGFPWTVTAAAVHAMNNWGRLSRYAADVSDNAAARYTYDTLDEHGRTETLTLNTLSSFSSILAVALLVEQVNQCAAPRG